MSKKKRPELCAFSVTFDPHIHNIKTLTKRFIGYYFKKIKKDNKKRFHLVGLSGPMRIDDELHYLHFIVNQKHIDDLKLHMENFLKMQTCFFGVKTHKIYSMQP